MLLLSRDIIRVHKVWKLNGPHDVPYAQKLDLGWVIVGDVCLGEYGSPFLFEPSPHRCTIKERSS